MKQQKYVTTSLWGFVCEQQVNGGGLNDRFWEWFGDSKMVEGGVPMVFYHGTKSTFTNFDKRKMGTNTDKGIRGKGFYFTNNLRTAQSYGDRLHNVYLKIENPFDLLSFDSLEGIVNLLGIDPSLMYERGRDTKYHSVCVKLEFSGLFTSCVKELGYDGIIHGQEFVCFEPGQIRSVVNDGSWDNGDGDIHS